MSTETMDAIQMLSSRNSAVRARAVDELSQRLSQGCWLSRLSLEYALAHDNNYRVKNKIITLFSKNGIKMSNIFWEEHFCF